MKTILTVFILFALTTSAFASSTIGFGVHPNLAFLNVSGCTNSEFRAQGRIVSASNTIGRSDSAQSSSPDPLIYSQLGLPSVLTTPASTTISMTGLAYFEYTNNGSNTCIYRLMGDSNKSHWSSFVIQ